MESCRRACGGHGYSLLSGLPTIFSSYVQNVTWEGDNNVLLLQACFPSSAVRIWTALVCKRGAWAFTLWFCMLATMYAMLVFC